LASQIIELDLDSSPDLRRAEVLLDLCDQLLDMLGDQLAEDGDAAAKAFRGKLDTWRKSLREERDPARLASLTRRIIGECEGFLDRTRDHRADREAEFIDLVRVLREVIDTVRGEARQFEDDLLRSTSAIERMVEIEDIRELKRELTREVQALRHAVADRQKDESKHYDRLTTRVASLEESLARARAEAATDALTGVPNRGAFDLTLREWLTRASRGGQGFCLAMVDLDNFKVINDTHGHPVGDRVLMAAARLLAGGVEQGELVARYGGEEFALLFAPPSASHARARLTALQRKVAPAYEYDLGGERRFLTFTFSAGVTEYASGDTPETIVKRADEALYDAKRRGKNRVDVRTRSILRGLMR
jgi:diguanylate cyclase